MRTNSCSGDLSLFHQPFMSVKVFPDLDQALVNANAEKYQKNQGQDDCCDGPNPIDVYDDVMTMESQIGWDGFNDYGAIIVASEKKS